MGYHDPAHSHGLLHFPIAYVLLFEALLETGALTSKGQFILEATMSDPDQEYRLRSARIPCSNVESVYKAFFKQQNKVVYKGTFQIRWREHGNIKWAAEKPQLSAQVAFDDSVFWLVKSMVLLVRFGDFVLFPSFHSILN